MEDGTRRAYTVPEAAREMGVSSKTAWRLVHGGKLRSFKVGSLRRVSAAAIDEFIHEGEQREAA